MFLPNLLLSIVFFGLWLGNAWGMGAAFMPWAFINLAIAAILAIAGRVAR